MPLITAFGNPPPERSRPHRNNRALSQFGKDQSRVGHKSAHGRCDEILILGLYNWDMERREASPIPEMETGTCRVAPFPLPDPREFRLRAVHSAVASRESMLGRARAGCSERLGRRCEN